MKPPLEMVGAVALAVVLAAPPAMAEESWPHCWRDDDCPGFFLTVMTVRGDARLSVSRSCSGAWEHIWNKRDARETIRQWLDDEAAVARGSLCIPLHPDVDEIRVASVGGHCGEIDFPEIAAANRPGDGAILQRGYGGIASATLEGCHARIGLSADVSEVAYGGVALDFTDGYVFGDTYADGHFYGVYDGFGPSSVKPFGASVAAISEFNTYHYRIEVLANDRDGWRWIDPEENDR